MSDISYENLCNLIALEMGGTTTPKSVKKFLRATYIVILNQLKLKHRIYFKGFGYWEIKERKSGEREINDPTNGGKRLVYVKPKYSIFFKPSVNFDASVNENDFKPTTDRIAKLLKKEKSKEVTSADLINRANSRMKE